MSATGGGGPLCNEDIAVGAAQRTKPGFEIINTFLDCVRTDRVAGKGRRCHYPSSAPPPPLSQHIAISLYR